MFGNWFGKRSASASGKGPAVDNPGSFLDSPLREAPQPRVLSGLDRELAIGFMSRLDSMLPLSEQDAETATGYLTSRRYKPGDSIFGGASGASDYVLWLLHGEITVATLSSAPGDPITMTVLEPGCTLGEIGFMDGNARSTECTACSEVRCAQLTRAAFKSLSSAHPVVGLKVATLISLGLAVRLRDVTEKFRRHVVMANLIRADQHREVTPGIAQGAD